MASEEFLLVDDREVVITDAMHVVCDGGGPLGHPREFITLEHDGEAMCKYCGRRYVHVGHAEAAAIRAAGRPYAA